MTSLRRAAVAVLGPGAFLGLAFVMLGAALASAFTLLAALLVAPLTEAASLPRPAAVAIGLLVGALVGLERRGERAGHGSLRRSGGQAWSRTAAHGEVT